MEYFVCPCPATGEVLLDGSPQGPNKDAAGNLLIKQCNEGVHTVSLRFSDGKTCSPREAKVEIADSDPIRPLKVVFRCVC